MALRWISVDLVTGQVLADLPQLVNDWPLKRTIGQYESATAHLPVRSAPKGWVRATKPFGAALIALDPDNRDTPIWGGIIVGRDSSLGATVDLELVTAEGYLDRRYVGDVTYTAVGQNSIVTDLANRFVLDGASGRPGLPLRVQLITAGAGAVRDRAYLDTDDRTVYAALQSLSGVLGGPEWTIEWEWQHGPERVTPVLKVGDRIGTAITPGFAPVATFASANEAGFGGNVTDVHLIEDYSTGKGANDIMAKSSSMGGVRPQSRATLPDFDGRPTAEFRWTPSTSITDVSTLGAHVQAALGLIGDGSSALTISAALAAAPRLGRDWVLGDDVGYDVKSLAWPTRLTGVARCVSWELDASAVTPILAASAVPTEDDGDDT